MGERNTAGENIVQFTSQMNMAIMNTYFKIDERHKQTYKSGVSMSQVEYIMCRGESRKECKNCTVILGGVEQRKRGSWLDCIKEDMEAVGVSPEDTQDQEEVEEVGPHGSNPTAIKWDKLGRRSLYIYI